MLYNIKDYFRRRFKAKETEVIFKHSAPLTLGVELEIQLIDPNTYNLSSRAIELLEAINEPNKVKPEIFKSFIEINTGICNTVQQAEADLGATIEKLKAKADSLGILLASTGCHPFARYEQCELYSSARYKDLIDRNQWIARRLSIFGLHVHLGMQSGDECIHFNNFFLHFIHHLLALSTSAPFWQGLDTGLATCRPTIFESMPTAGLPNHFTSWRQFIHQCKVFEKCGAIHSLKDLWWDLRPSPNFGTLEIRICDGTATIREACAIVAYIHSLAHWFRDNASWIETFPTPRNWLLRENKWRVIRYGLDASIVTNSTGSIKPLKEDILEWVDKLRPYAQKLGYEKYFEDIKNICLYGSSSQRQKTMFSDATSLEEIVKFNVKEFNTNKPNWD
jgi:carboxylate-amine ligase